MPSARRFAGDVGQEGCHGGRPNRGIRLGEGVVSVTIEGGQIDKVDGDAGAGLVSGSHGVGHRRREEMVVGGVEPKLRQLVASTQEGRRVDQALSPAADMFLVVTAASAGEADHAHHARWRRVCERDGAETASRLAHHNNVLSIRPVQCRRGPYDRRLDSGRFLAILDVVPIPAGTAAFQVRAIGSSEARPQGDDNHIALNLNQ